MHQKKGDIDGLSPIESTIMKSVWAGNNTTRTIYDGIHATAKKRLAFTTVASYLMRMVQKGYLKRTPTEGREYVFTALITQETLEDEKIEKFDVSDKRIAPFLRRFAGRSAFTTRERDLLKKMAERLEKQFGKNEGEGES